jgi:uncharacterized protein YcfJ
MVDTMPFEMIQNVPPSTHPQIPDGSKMFCLADPSRLDSCTQFPIIVCCRNTYWVYAFLNNSILMNIVQYDPNGVIVKQWVKQGARYLWSITSDDAQKTVNFIGQGRATINMTWDELGLLKFKATADDILYIAQAYNLTISQQDATRLAAALPEFNCSNCTGSVKRSATLTSWTVGAIIGGFVGGAVGAILGGPAGAAAGAAIGAASGANFGLTIPEPPAPSIPVPISQESQTYVFRSSYPVGPFDNGAVFEDLFRWNFPRYGNSEWASAIGPAKGVNKINMWYPVQRQFLDPLCNYPSITGPTGRPMFKFIFVVVQVSNVNHNGNPAYQVRTSCQEFCLNAPDRLNHSQLSEGGRFAALMGAKTMQVFGAGSLYIEDGEIVGMDSRTGHYYYSIGDENNQSLMLNTVKSLLGDLGYDISKIKINDAFSSYLNGLY